MNSRKAGNEKVSVTFKHPTHSQHWAGIESICLGFAPGTLFTASRDCSVKSWRQEWDQSWSFEHNLESHTGWVTSVVAMNGVLVTASYDTTVKLWDPTVPKRPLYTFNEHTDYVLNLAPAPITGKIVSAGLRGDIRFWDVESCKAFALASHSRSPTRAADISGGCVSSGSVYALHCTPDMSLVAFSASDGSIRLYDPRAAQLVSELKGHRDNVRSVQLSADGRRLVSGSSDRTVRIWDLGMVACTANFEQHSDSVWALAADECARCIVSGGRDGRVFVTDVTTARTDLLSHVDHPVLDLEVDWGAGTVWVGTTDSDVTSWTLPLAPPCHKVHCHPLSTNSRETALSLSRSLIKRTSMPKYKPQQSSPLAVLPGVPALIRHAVFEDRRHILTLDSQGSIRLWDVVRCKDVQGYDSDQGFEEVYRQLFPTLLSTVPPWFTSDVQQGVLTLSMTNPQAFSAELYATAIGMACPDDVKLNYGHQLLTNVLTVWRLKCEGRSVSSASLDTTMTSFTSLMESTHTRPCFQTVYARDRRAWRLDMLDFTGREHEMGMLPDWVQNAVWKGIYKAPISNLKLAFTLSPGPSDNLPPLSMYRLTAPIILEIRKVTHYVKEKLAEADIHVTTNEVTFNEINNHNTWSATPGRILVITCLGKLVPSSMTLNTIKRYICTGRVDDDIPLEFTILNRKCPPQLPQISPKDVANH